MHNLKEAHSQIRSELLGDAPEVKQEFRNFFTSEIDEFIGALSEAVVGWRKLDDHLDQDVRRAACSGFIFITINTLLLSTKLIIEGHLIASGNLLRQVTECIPMPLLIANREIGIYERFSKDQYSTNRSIQDAIRHADRLGAKKDSLEELKNIQKRYDVYSHPSKGTMAAYMSFEVKHGLYLGASFDKGKTEAYGKEMRLRVSLAQGLPNIIEGTLNILGMQ